MNMAVVKRTKHQTTVTTATFDHYIVVRNPVSTHAARVRRQVQELCEKVPPMACTVLDTSPQGRQATAHLLLAHKDKLGPRTLLVIAGGDGTVNTLIDVLLYDQRLTSRMRKTVVLPLWGGNANDLAHMLNGSPKRPTTLLASGTPVTVRPLQCIFTTANGTEQRIAICYASFGASAFAASQLDLLRGKRHFLHNAAAGKFIYELGRVVRALVDAPRFRMETGDTIKTIYEQSFMNGSRFAKVNGVPIKLTDEVFCRVIVENKRVSAVTFHLMEIIRRRTAQRIMTTAAASFTLQDDTWAQVDGEVMRLTAGTTVRIAASPNSFYALSTKLR